MDPEIWGDPENFRPERFISKDGTFKKDEHLMPFGYGKVHATDTASEHIHDLYCTYN